MSGRSLRRTSSRSSHGDVASEPVLGAVAAVAAVVALAVGLWASNLSSELDETRAALDRARAATAIVANPDSRTVALESGTGRLVVDPDGGAALVLLGLGPAPEGSTYETWIIEGDVPRSRRPLPGRDGIDVVAVDGKVDPGTVVAVTVEPAGGVTASGVDPSIGSDRAFAGQCPPGDRIHFLAGSEREGSPRPRRRVRRRRLAALLAVLVVAAGLSFTSGSCARSRVRSRRSTRPPSARTWTP